MEELDYEIYKEAQKRPPKTPSFADFPTWLKALETVCMLVVGLAIFVYTTPGQIIIPTWTLIPKYPVAIGLICFVVMNIRTYIFLRRVYAYKKTLQKAQIRNA